MASSSLLPTLLLLLLVTPTALSTTCKTQKFTTPNKSFANCADLPYLSSTLHYTFNPSKSTLSIAFTAPPSQPSGWVAWAINPTSNGMAGAQALLAYTSPNGSVAVSPFNIQSYSAITPGPLSIKVSDVSGESSSSSLTLFATWHLPSKTESVNHVWQVGPSVSNGFPAKHDFAQPNLNSKSKLQLSSSSSSSGSPKTTSGSPAEAPSAGAPASAKITGGAASAPAPASGKNDAGEGVAGLVRFGAGLGLVGMAVAGFLF